MRKNEYVDYDGADFPVMSKFELVTTKTSKSIDFPLSFIAPRTPRPHASYYVSGDGVLRAAYGDYVSVPLYKWKRSQLETYAKKLYEKAVKLNATKHFQLVWVQDNEWKSGLGLLI